MFRRVTPMASLAASQRQCVVAGFVCHTTAKSRVYRFTYEL